MTFPPLIYASFPATVVTTSRHILRWFQLPAPQSALAHSTPTTLGICVSLSLAIERPHARPRAKRLALQGLLPLIYAIMFVCSLARSLQSCGKWRVLGWLHGRASVL